MAGEAQRAVNVIQSIVDSSTNNGAKFNYTPGIIEESFGSGYFASAYVRIDDYIEDVDIPAGMNVAAGDYVMIAETGTGNGWIEYVLPTNDYSKLALDFERRQILSGDGLTPPVPVIEFNDLGEMTNPTTGATVGGSPAGKVYEYNNFQ